MKRLHKERKNIKKQQGEQKQSLPPQQQPPQQWVSQQQQQQQQQVLHQQIRQRIELQHQQLVSSRASAVHRVQVRGEGKLRDGSQLAWSGLQYEPQTAHPCPPSLPPPSFPSHVDATLQSSISPSDSMCSLPMFIEERTKDKQQREVTVGVNYQPPFMSLQSSSVVTSSSSLKPTEAYSSCTSISHSDRQFSQASAMASNASLPYLHHKTEAALAQVAMPLPLTTATQESNLCPPPSLDTVHQHHIPPLLCHRAGTQTMIEKKATQLTHPAHSYPGSISSVSHELPSSNLCPSSSPPSSFSRVATHEVSVQVTPFESVSTQTEGLEPPLLMSQCTHQLPLAAEHEKESQACSPSPPQLSSSQLAPPQTSSIPLPVKFKDAKHRPQTFNQPARDNKTHFVNSLSSYGDCVTLGDSIWRGASVSVEEKEEEEEEEEEEEDISVLLNRVCDTDALKVVHEARLKDSLVHKVQQSDDDEDLLDELFFASNKSNY